MNVTKKPKTEAQEAHVNVERVSVDELKLDPKNARRHPDRNLAAIRASLERFGQQKPIVVKKDGTVIAGNGTLEAARLLGWTHLDVVRTSLDGADAAAFAIADNRTGELSEWDVNALIETLKGAAEGGDAVPGFTQHDVEMLLKDDWHVEPKEKVEPGEVKDITFKVIIDGVSHEDRENVVAAIGALLAEKFPRYTVAAF